MIAVDHLTLAVDDLDRAVREFRSAGYTVHDGSHDRRSSTVTALVACGDDTYLELIAFDGVLARTPARRLAVSRRSAPERLIADGLANAGGAFAVVLRVDDLDIRVKSLRENGFTVENPLEFDRTTRGGDRSTWRLAASTDPTVPLLIEDSTRAGQRIPAGSQVRIAQITTLTSNPTRTEQAYAALLGAPERPGRWRLGGTTLAVRRGAWPNGGPRVLVRLDAPALPAAGVALGLSLTADDPGDAITERLGEAIRLQTVSYEDPAEVDDTQFVALGELIEASFPLVHETLELERFGHSRLYTWRGTDPGEPAALFLAHQDVVPVDDVDGWTHPPFDGVVDDEFIWGRGAIDDKSRVFALLEAIEAALVAGFRPRRTLLFAFGHDEEVNGEHGASVMAHHLRTNGIRAGLLLDEGGVVTRGIVAGVDRPVATIMVSEKGFATVRLSVTDTGGHSSMPPKQTAVGRLARAVTRIQDHPMPLRLSPAVLDMVRRLAPVMTQPRRGLLAAADKVGPVIARVMTSSPASEALVRTTTAPTVIHGGVKRNVLPQKAEALVNFRLLHGDTIADVIDHCRTVVDDVRVTVDLAPGPDSWEASPVTSADGPEFAMIAGIVDELLPGVAITSGLVPGATDSRFFTDLVDARFNFAPIILDQADLDRIHGTDERIARLDYGRLITFNRKLFERLQE